MNLSAWIASCGSARCAQKQSTVKSSRVYGSKGRGVEGWKGGGLKECRSRGAGVQECRSAGVAVQGVGLWGALLLRELRNSRVYAPMLLLLLYSRYRSYTVLEP